MNGKITNDISITSRSMDRTEKEVDRINTYSEKCIELVKKYEGCKLKAYKLPGEKNYTIGYGISNSSIKEGQTITQEEAESLLRQELNKCSKRVLSLNLNLNQGQYDALVSFTYNCGEGNLIKLTKDRTLEEIAEHITAYTKSSSESNRRGLLKRRLEEKELFMKEQNNEEKNK